jgi:hypothetical protein
MKNLIYILFLLLLFSCQVRDKEIVKIEGEMQQWHKLTLLDGPVTAEWEREKE